MYCLMTIYLGIHSDSRLMITYENSVVFFDYASGAGAELSSSEVIKVRNIRSEVKRIYIYISFFF